MDNMSGKAGSMVEGTGDGSVGMKSEGRSKKRPKLVRKGPYVAAIVVLAVLAVAGVGFGVYGMMTREEVHEEKEVVEEETEVVDEADGDEKSEDVDVDLKLASDKFLGDGIANYRLSDTFGSGDNAVTVFLHEYMGGAVKSCDTEEKYADDETELAISVNWDEMSKMYSVASGKSGWETVKIEGVDADEVVDVLVAGFGNGVGAGTTQVLLLMADGTVEYMPLIEVLADGQFKSYGKVDGMKDIVRIRRVSAGGCGGGLTAIAQKANGEFYDLYEVLKGQGVL